MWNGTAMRGPDACTDVMRSIDAKESRGKETAAALE